MTTSPLMIEIHNRTARNPSFQTKDGPRFADMPKIRFSISQSATSRHPRTSNRLTSKAGCRRNFSGDSNRPTAPNQAKSHVPAVFVMRRIRQEHNKIEPRPSRVVQRARRSVTVVKHTSCPHRLEAQDAALSRRQQGFKSPWGYSFSWKRRNKPLLSRAYFFWYSAAFPSFSRRTP